jgi:hypothetical protein
MLLRQAGVPSRLVAGFRTYREPFRGLTAIKDQDAHAWVEYFLPGEGWRALDLTPRVSTGLGFLEDATDWYLLFESYWYRYILLFDWKKAVGALFSGGRIWQWATALTVLVLLAGAWRASREYRKRAKSPRKIRLLEKERRRFDRRESRLSPDKREGFLALYHELRYGPEDRFHKNRLKTLREFLVKE